MKTRTGVEKAYGALGVAVVRYAAKDYERGVKLLSKNRHRTKGWLEGTRLINETTAFFHSKQFNLFMNADGPAIFKKIKRNMEKYGRSMLYETEE